MISRATLAPRSLVRAAIVAGSLLMAAASHAQAIAPDAPEDVRAGRLENGLQYVIARTKEVPPVGAATGRRVYVDMRIATGRVDVPLDKYEMHHLLEHMLIFYRAEGRRKLDTNDWLKAKGVPENSAYLNGGSGQREMTFEAAGNAEFTGHFLEHMRQILQGSKFRAEELAAQKTLVLAEDPDRGQVPTWQVDPVPPGSPIPTLRNRELLWKSMNRITLKDVNDFYKKNFHSNRTAIVVIGDIDTRDVEKDLRKRFSALKPGPKANAAAIGDYSFASAVVPNTKAINILLELGVERGDRQSPDQRMLTLKELAVGLIGQRLEDLRRYGQTFSIGELRHNNTTDPSQLRSAWLSFSAGGSVLADALREAGLALQSLGMVSPSEISEQRLAVKEQWQRAPRGFLNERYHRAILAGKLGEELTTVAPSASFVDDITDDEIRSEVKRLVNFDKTRIAIYGPRGWAPIFTRESSVRRMLGQAVVTNVNESPPWPLALSDKKPIDIRDAGRGVRKMLVNNGEMTVFFVKAPPGSGASLLIQGKIGAQNQAIAAARLDVIDQLIKRSGIAGRIEQEIQSLYGVRKWAVIRNNGSYINFRSDKGDLGRLLLVAHRYFRDPEVQPIVRRDVALELERAGQRGAQIEVTSESALENLSSAGVLEASLPTDLEIRNFWRDQFGDMRKLIFVVSGDLEETEVAEMFARSRWDVLPSLAARPDAAALNSAMPPDERFVQAAIEFRFPAKQGDWDRGVFKAALRIVSPLLYERLRTKEGGVYGLNFIYNDTNFDAFSGSAKLVLTFACRKADVDRLVTAARDEVERVAGRDFSPAEKASFEGVAEPNRPVTGSWILQNATFPLKDAYFHEPDMSAPKEHEVRRALKILAEARPEIKLTQFD